MASATDAIDPKGTKTWVQRQNQVSLARFSLMRKRNEVRIPPSGEESEGGAGLGLLATHWCPLFLTAGLGTPRSHTPALH